MNTTTTTIDKWVKLGTLPHPWNEAGRRVPVFCHIQYGTQAHRPDDAPPELSISGVEGPTPSGNCVGSCGQIDLGYREPAARDAIDLAPGWDRPMLDQFFAIWHDWHLNRMRAGTVAQRAELAAHRYDRSADGDHYDWAKRTLAAADLDPDPGYLHDGEPYRYGSAWLGVDVPPGVLSFLVDLPSVQGPAGWS